MKQVQETAAGWWIGFAGPFASLKEAQHYAAISGGDPAQIYLCNADGTLVGNN